MKLPVSTLADDERKFIDYVASRIVMSYGEAATLRRSIATRYSLDDSGIKYFLREILRRTGLSNKRELLRTDIQFEPTATQRELINKAVAYISPYADLGEEQRPRQLPPALPSREQKSSEPQLLCSYCVSSTGKNKTIFRGLADAVNLARDALISYGQNQEPYCCPHGNDWHLRTVKPISISDTRSFEINEPQQSVPSKKNIQESRTSQPLIAHKESQKASIQIPAKRALTEPEQAAKSISFWNKKWGKS